MKILAMTWELTPQVSPHEVLVVIAVLAYRGWGVAVSQLIEWSPIDLRVGGLQPDSFPPMLKCPTEAAEASGAGLKPGNQVKCGWLHLEGYPT